MKRVFFISLVSFLECASVLIAAEKPSVTAHLEQTYSYAKFTENNGLEYYLIAVHPKGQDNGWLIGVADVDGKVIIPCKYYKVRPSGLYVSGGYDFNKFQCWSIQDTHGKYGVANSSGKIIIPCEHDGQVNIHEYHDALRFEKIDYSVYGYALTMGSDTRCLYDEKGNLIIPLSRGYKYIYSQVNTLDGTKLYKVKYTKDKDGKVGLCDSDGTELLPVIYNDIHDWNSSDGYPTRYIKITTDKGEGLYDYKRKIIAVSPKYEKYSINIYLNLFTLHLEDGYRIYYDDDLLLTADKVFGNWKDNKEKYLRYTKDGKDGLINQLTGKVLACRFDSIMYISNGNVTVKEGENVRLYSLADLENNKIESMASITKDNVNNAVLSDVDQNIPQTKLIQENTFAVIIANENYNNLTVPSANNDGKVFKEYCLKSLGVPKENLIYYEDATINNIHAAVNRVRDLAEVFDEGCKVIFYYSGQGISDEQTKEMYLIPSDGTLKAVSSTCYSLSKLYSEIGTLENVQEALFLIDAPFNGMTRDNKPIQQARGVALKSKPNNVTGNAIAFEAAAGGETALVYNKQNHGLFTYFLLKAIQNNTAGKPLTDLYTEVNKNVREIATRELQTPQNVQLKKANK